MRDSIVAVGLAAVLVPASGACSAMSAPRIEASRCQVAGGDKLPAATGGPAALCRAVEQAVAAAGVSTRYSIRVRVLGPAALAATITTSTGRVLPEQNFRSMDRDLAASSIKRFADSLAVVVAEAEER